jgi:hypothetical protein
LGYKPNDWRIAESKAAVIVLFALWNEEGSLTLLVHPDLRSVVMKDDQAYFDSLLPDLVERSRLHPLALFKQLCSLGLGPLVTQEAGKSISDHPALLVLSSRFVQLCGSSFLLQSSTRSIIVSAIREVLTQADDPNVPLPEREGHELHLYDSTSEGEPAYCVRDVLCRWDDERKSVVRDEAPIETFMTLEEAKKCYFERRLALAQQGFVHSDIDLF